MDAMFDRLYCRPSTSILSEQVDRVEPEYIVSGADPPGLRLCQGKDMFDLAPFH
jgi:hypothetical protein